MLERALKGGPKYWAWILFLLAVIGAGGAVWIWQLVEGLTLTDMSRDVSWGFYIAQLTYLVGVAASGVMIVLPYYFHHYKKYKHLVIFGEFLAIAACLMCMLFVVVDLGQPQRMLNIVFHPTPNSILFWDMIVLNGYLFLNLIIGWTCLGTDLRNQPHPKWVKWLVYLSIVWAFSIHTVTAFLYQGLPGRHFWLTAILAARFLASAFCAGPAILLLLLQIVKKFTSFDPGWEATKNIARTIAYAMVANVFFFLLEVFTAFYSGIPGHQHALQFFFVGLDGNTTLVPWMWTFVIGAVVSLALLIPPKLRENKTLLPIALIILVIATWIDKGLGLLIGGFTPNPFEGVTSYWPSWQELAISAMVFAIGGLVITVLFKVAVSVKQELEVSQKGDVPGPVEEQPAEPAEAA
ncbi:putative sulfite reductase-associated electron transfer protein DsrP [Paucidesulfovibrio gracilis DSM 16080]|uniref:Putative sulfite reductase-associated electron transfer protein DsrP n=1 Tax=Paucidesulfovibrio gracilis DSM 16080 TaxID=1121449 RepID=A0A1T4XMG9_9BACT|nr:NrfD/PsrC family molybdoenzyme membrane anchor subunit [Paucidesulfovibrio gracilis]SKA90716.1 putative sulfite reductase-associated electron transfer protein DsrP [Paucidesulfovibrio gracilis DSM 16080]